jgi:NDP-sugar pyrophosphorylase family protein
MREPTGTGNRTSRSARPGRCGSWPAAETGAALTIAVKSKQVQIDLGVLEMDGARVTGFQEKPTLGYDVSMGIYAYDTRALGHMPDGPCQFPELVQLLLDAGETVCAYRSQDDWFDIGTVGEYERALGEVERRGGWPG